MYNSDHEHENDEFSTTKPEYPAAVGSTINIDGRQFTVHRLFFSSSHQAATSGFHPVTYWKKQGHAVVDVAMPALVVRKSWRTYHSKDDEILLAYSLLNEHLVSSRAFFEDIQTRGCWPVYSKDQTEPLKSVNKDKSQEQFAHPKQRQKKRERTNETKEKNCLQETTNTSTTTPLTTPPYDGESHTENDANNNNANDLCQGELRSRLITTPRRGRKLTVYMPEGFNWDDYPVLAPYRSSVMWLLHRLHEDRFTSLDGRVYEKDGYIPIKSEYARNVDPRFREVVKVLLDADFVERDWYEEGVKSYGYRLVDPELRRAKRHRVPLDDPKLAKRIRKSRTDNITTRLDRWLHSQLFKLALEEVDEEFLKWIAFTSTVEGGGSYSAKIDSYKWVLEKIALREHILKPDNQGRRYSLITNMKRELRKYLRVDGSPLQQIDIANSQWTFLALEMRRAGIDCEEYFRLCEQGRLYETVAEDAKSTRAKVKKLLTQRALFSGNDDACQRSKIKRTFDRLFPEVAEFIRQAKEHGDGGRLAKTLQAAEADLIIDGVCNRLRREGRVKFLTPVHDCQIFHPDDGAYVKAVMEEEFAKLKISPKLEIKDL